MWPWNHPFLAWHFSLVWSLISEYRHTIVCLKKRKKTSQHYKSPISGTPSSTLQLVNAELFSCLNRPPWAVSYSGILSTPVVSCGAHTRYARSITHAVCPQHLSVMPSKYVLQPQLLPKFRVDPAAYTTDLLPNRELIQTVQSETNTLPVQTYFSPIFPISRNDTTIGSATNPGIIINFSFLLPCTLQPKWTWPACWLN